MKLLDRRLHLILVSMLILMVLPASPAWANHPANACLDVTEETATNTTGTQHVITATMRTGSSGSCAGAAVTPSQGQVTVSFELTGANDPDGSTANSPDLTCDIRNNESSCTVSYSGTVAGTDLIRGWIADGTLDAAEGRDETTTPGAVTEPDVTDVVQKTWNAPVPGTITKIDASPETATNTLTTGVDSHAMAVIASDSNNTRVTSTTTPVRFAISSGPNAGSNAATAADGSCAVAENFDPAVTGETHRCSYTNTTDTVGTDLIKIFADLDNDSVWDSNEPFDDVQKSWATSPGQLTMSPTGDTASVGVCNPFTITLLDTSGRPVSGAVIDVEQIHSTATDSVSGNEPTVGFCTPTSGTNPTSVDASRGDLDKPDENPDNEGTAGGETLSSTDAAGKVTIGVTSTGGQGSSGAGTVAVTAFFDANGDDDPGSAEPKATSTKTWVVAEGRFIDCGPETATNVAGTGHTVTCQVRDRFGDLVPGVSVTFAVSGVGSLSSAAVQVTNGAGEVTATSTSNTAGTQTIRGTITADLEGAEPSHVDDCDRAANDPTGSLAGTCQDEVTKTWTQPQAASVSLTPGETTSLPGQTQTFTVTVRDANGQPVQGASVAWSAAGVGTFVSTETVTDANGQADAVVTSAERGTQSVTATVTPCATSAGCSSVAVANWGPAECDIFGTEGVDLLEGTDASEVICGFGGGDTILGGGGDDVILGGKGADVVRAGEGNDFVRAQRGHDHVFGGSGDDVLRGGYGRDYLNGGLGSDLCRGGPGADRKQSCER